MKATKEAAPAPAKKAKATTGGAADPAGFAEWCSLLGTIQLGEREFAIDIAAIDEWAAAQPLSEEARARLSSKRAAVVAACLANNCEDAREGLTDLHQLVHMLRALPLAKHGATFKAGRKTDTIGPVRKFLRTYLAKNPKAKPAQAWDAIKAKPPRGVTVHDPLFRSRDRRVNWAGGPTSYRQFQNLVSEERPKK